MKFIFICNIISLYTNVIDSLPNGILIYGIFDYNKIISLNKLNEFKEKKLQNLSKLHFIRIIYNNCLQCYNYEDYNLKVNLFLFSYIY